MRCTQAVYVCGCEVVGRKVFVTVVDDEEDVEDEEGVTDLDTSNAP